MQASNELPDADSAAVAKLGISVCVGSSCGMGGRSVGCFVGGGASVGVSAIFSMVGCAVGSCAEGVVIRLQAKVIMIPILRRSDITRLLDCLNMAPSISILYYFIAMTYYTSRPEMLTSRGFDLEPI